MAGNSYFQFKQFTVSQQNAAMKVGTDGVLLGAWSNVNDARKLLDIGTGTGLIALMVAQRCEASIIAVDIDEKACWDARSNVQNSPWPDRIEVVHSSFPEWLTDIDQSFDCVVSNPPFFNGDVLPKSVPRGMARHHSALPFEKLIKGVAQCLTPKGHFDVILPVDSERQFRNIAASYRFFPERITRVKPKPSKPVSRVLIEFRFEAITAAEEILTIETETHHEYQSEFIELVKSYYLTL